MFNAAGEKFSIHAHCNQQYKKQYIIDNYLDATNVNRLVIKEHVEGKNINAKK